ncbi:efflux RND transporter permease subunit [Bacteroides sp. 224]|uniref:efflux RND transporter permease subunit n=1 Tax=Bacteroides sp. 224 TaxID=2302936 RepID=UPI0019402373|nr:efflux RND transporter permease subunit [Bacteroides sp. 224]NDV67191.1 efflux RND transporter permease subunit [Bacteroides sp. 224]
MIDLGNWGLKNRKLVNFLIAALVVGGVLATKSMGKLEDPELIVKQALVVTTYPGASAHQVEMEVTDVLEKSIRTMKNIEYVESRSMNDLSMITVNLSTLVSNEEVDGMWTLLRRKVTDAQPALPEGTSVSVVKDDFGDVMGMFYALTSDGFSDRELGDYAELLKRNILEIEGISRVDIYGQNKECINIELYEDKIANLGIFPAEVLSTLGGQNKTVYSGYYDADVFRIRVTVNDKYRNVEDIENLLLQGHQGDQFRLKDIAKVSMGYETPVRNSMSYDNQKALGIAISALTEADIIQVGKKVEDCVQKLSESRLPAGIEMHKVFFQPDRVNNALNTFMINLIESVAIVVFILIFTMGLRSGIIIGLNLIIIVFGSILVLNITGGTLQRVSLAAFILAMGMLVDNAIVILDGILIDMQRGISKQESLTAIGRKTAMPLLGATLIAILAFFPIFLSPDTAGIYVRDLFIVLAVSLLLSWVLALVYVPIQADNFLKIKKDKEGKDPFDNTYYKALRKTLSWVLHHRTVTISLTVVLLFISLFCFRFLPQGFFPDMDYDQLYIEYKLPEGTSSNKVHEDLQAITNYLLTRKEITHVTASVGGTPARYNLVRSVADPSLSYGELIVDYTSSKELVATMDEIQHQLTVQYPDAYVRLKRYNLMYKKYPIEVQFNGPDPAILCDLTNQALAIMEESPTVFLARSSWEPKKPTLMVDYNQPIARNVGLSRQDVGLSLLSATDGIPASVFYDNNHKQTIYLKSVTSRGNPIESLENTSIFSMMPSIATLDKDMLYGLMSGSYSGEDAMEEILRTIPLSQVTDGIKFTWEDPLVIRYNGQRAMRAQCNPVNGVGAEDARASIAQQIEAIKLPDGYTMQWEGERKASTQSTTYLFKHFPLAIVLMIAILIMLFKDYKKPVVIFCCIPLLLIGVIFGMLASGKTFGFVAIVGVLGLIGMIIKNGIVLMDEITLQLHEGVEPIKALLDSSSSRFRPVMMASMTTILGMIPLLSDDLFGPLAVTIMGGLLVGTLITLLIIPILYSLFFKIKINK